MSGQAGLTMSGRADAITLWLPWALRSVNAFVISSSIKQVCELQLVAGVNRNQSMLYFKKLLSACELIFLPVLKETKILSSFPSPSVSLDTLQQNAASWHLPPKTLPPLGLQKETQDRFKLDT